MIAPGGADRVLLAARDNGPPLWLARTVGRGQVLLVIGSVSWRWARSLDARTLVRSRTASTRLWESPWLFALVVGMLSVEWAWRRRRGLM